jgi:L-threonylcarbamoyladenylate synthase
LATIGKDIEKASELLRKGQLVSIPTETVYGLAANGLDPIAVAKIFEVKKRPFFNPLILHIGHLDQVAQLTTGLNSKTFDLLEALWPGPVTVLLPKSGLVPEITVAGNTKVAIRMPNHPLALKLLKNIDFPLAAPSANPFGYISPTDAGHVQTQLGRSIEYILDGGACKVGIESTIIEPMGEECNVLRYGGMPVKNLERFFKTVHHKTHGNSNPLAPGMLDKHYSPNTPFELYAHGEKPPMSHNGLYILFTDMMTEVPVDRKLILSPMGNMAEAASNLFKFMRQADEGKWNKIYATKVPNEGLGMAINDRLNRAAHQ